jgi:hypothetical protein
MKRRIQKIKGLIRGLPSAVLFSAVFHIVLLSIAGGVVVFSVIKKEEKKFIPPKPIERPKMDLKKPRVKVRKTAAPRTTKRIAAKNIQQAMSAIQLPEISGMSAGLSGGIGGFEMLPDPSEMTLFGGKSSASIGNDFEGTFYALELDRRGRKTGMSDEKYDQEVRRFLENGWSPRTFVPYYRAPQKLYATQIMIPPLTSDLGPAQFGMGGKDFDPIHWLIHYKGRIAYKKGGKFRFWGSGDDIMQVRVDGKVVLDASWDFHRDNITDWLPSSEEDRKYFFGHAVSATGDWFELAPDTPVEMEILIGECPGGIYNAMLLVEEYGVEYPKNRGGAPILPVFKTAEMPEQIKAQIEYTLIEGEADLDDGPMFNVY